HHEDIDRETDQYGGKIGQPFKSPVSIAILDDDAFPVHIAELAQRLLESGDTTLDDFSREACQKTDPRNSLPRLLPLDSERRKNEAESETDREPDQPHRPLVGMAGGSLAERHSTHQRPGRDSTGAR